MRVKPLVDLLQYDLLRTLPSTAHDGGEEPSVANLPQAKLQINCGVAGQQVTIGIECNSCDVGCVALEDLPLGGGSHIVDSDGAFVRSNSQALTLLVEGNHRELLHHNRENVGDQLVGVLAERQVVRVEALEQNLGQLDKVRLEVFAVSSDRQLKNFKHVLLELLPVVKTDCLLLHKGQVIDGEVLRDFKQSFDSS